MNIMYYFDKGGVIMYILLALNIIGFTTMIFKFIQLQMEKSNTQKSIHKMNYELESHNKEAQSTLSKDLVTEKMVSYERGLSTIRIIASIAPLLGLLGTAIGVLSAFEAISKQGLDDPSVFASGISLALITTVGGLIVAIPHYIGYNYLIGMLDKLEAKLGKEMSLNIIEKR